MGRELYGVPPEQVIGGSIKTKYEVRDGKPVMVRLPEIELHQRQERQAGRHPAAYRASRPIAAFGNSDGDFEMLEWTTSAPGARLGLIVHHDAAGREFAYDRKSHVGQLDRGLNEGRRSWVGSGEHQERLARGLVVWKANKTKVHDTNVTQWEI